MRNQLGFEKAINALIYTEWTNGYTIFSFKVTDRQINSCTEGFRKRSTTGSIQFKVGCAAPQNTNIKVIILS